jgi:hypothetical protein
MIPITPETMIGRYGPQYAWNYINVNFAVMGKLNLISALALLTNDSGCSIVELAVEF